MRKILISKWTVNILLVMPIIGAWIDLGIVDAMGVLFWEAITLALIIPGYREYKKIKDGI